MENLDKFAPLIFLVIWALIAGLGRKKKASSASGSSGSEPKPNRPAPPPVFGNVRETIDNLISELGGPVQPAARPKPVAMQEPSAESRQETKPAELEKWETKARTHTPTQEQTGQQPPAVPNKVARLRRAVIWSEILGPPVSLRQE